MDGTFKENAMKYYRLLLVLFIAFGFAVRAGDHKWHRSIMMNGNGIMQGPLMDIKGSKLKVKYSSGDNSPILIELYSEDGSQKMELVKSSNRQTLSGVRFFAPKKGFERGYLKVRGSYNGWQVQFEQFVDDVRGWQLTRLEKQSPEIGKIAAWSGDVDETAELPVSLDAKRSRLRFRALDNGRLKVEVIGEDGSMAALLYMFRQGVYDTWLYRPGEYKVRLTQASMPWTLEVDSVE